MSATSQLERFVLNLLALAEARGSLTSAEEQALAELSIPADPSPADLARVGLAIHTALLANPQFLQAKARWDLQSPERYGLDVGELLRTLGGNPEPRPASGGEALQVPEQRVLDAASNEPLLARLAAELGLSWPAPGKASSQDREESR